MPKKIRCDNILIVDKKPKKCNEEIGNTLYLVGDKRLCPVCWLGKEEGNKTKYKKKDNAWTEEKLKEFKDKRKNGSS